MNRATKIALGILAVWMAVAVYWLHGVKEQVSRLGEPDTSDAQAHREVTQSPTASSSDAEGPATLYWASPAGDSLTPSEVELPLSSDPALRARQLLNALITRVPSPRQRTVPAEAALLEFYLLPEGTAIADFSGALAAATPSGILSEQLAVDSITRTLAANVPSLRRIKIVIQGQEMETLAGHVDLSGFFELRAAATPAPAKETQEQAARQR